MGIVVWKKTSVNINPREMEISVDSPYHTSQSPPEKKKKKTSAHVFRRQTSTWTHLIIWNYEQLR